MHRFLAALILPAAAWAAPTTVTHEGRLLDAQGTPLNGTHSIQFRLWDTTTGTQIWTETHTITAMDGHYAVVLGNTTPIDDTVLSSDTIELGIEIDGGGELPTRTPLSSVPFAVVARSVRGGPVDATAISISGTPTVPTRGSNMYELAIGGNTTLDTTFSHDIYTCGNAQVVHVEASITHWSATYRATADKIFYMDSYTAISADTLLDAGTPEAGNWSFQRIVTGNNGYGDTSNRLRITHNAGTYNGSANYYIFIRSTCPIYEF